MSQFMVCVSEKNLLQFSCKKIEQCKDNKTFIMGVIERIFKETDINSIWVFEQIDKLYTNTQKDINKGILFKDTKLYSKLDVLCDMCKKIVLWYGNDYEELDEVKNKNDFMSIIQKDVQNSMCESYICFSRM